MRTVLLSAFLGLAAAARADHFDEHTGEEVSQVEGSKVAKKISKLTVRQIAIAPHPISGHPSSCFLAVKTDRGNWSKLLVRYARIETQNSDKPTELMLIKRLVTYASRSGRAVLADKGETYLFDGFGVDLDVGQIVPKNTGEDLRFSAADQAVVVVGDAEMYFVGAPLVKPKESTNAGFSKGAISVADFTGKYRLAADGRWSGLLTITVDDGGNVKGTYVSEQSGRAYDVKGQVGNPTNRIKFTVTFPMTRQEFDGYMWTRKRTRISGVTQMEGSRFGFVADRTD